MRLSKEDNKKLNYKPKSAWSPDQLKYIAVFCTMVPGALLYCINYAKLDHPYKKKRILTVIGVTLLLCLFSYLSPVNTVFYILFFLINAAISLYIAYDQKDFYVEHIKNKGGQDSIVLPAILSALAIISPFLIYPLFN